MLETSDQIPEVLDKDLDPPILYQPRVSEILLRHVDCATDGLTLLRGGNGAAEDLACPSLVASRPNGQLSRPTAAIDPLPPQKEAKVLADLACHRNKASSLSKT